MPYESWAERNKREEPGRSQGRGIKPGSLGCLAIRERSDSVKLLKLSLNNFKGIKSFTLEPQGEDVNIYGDNAVGKTTIFDAFTWLLFGKDSLNRADFEIKTRGLMVNRSTVWSTGRGRFDIAREGTHT